MEHTFKTSSKFHSNDVALPRPEWQPRSQALSPLPPVFTKEAEERRGCQNAIFSCRVSRSVVLKERQ